MKETLKDFGNIVVDILLTFLLTFLILNMLLFTAVTVASGQELTLDQEVVAKTILGEARGEGKGGMYAVACVIAQRSIMRSRTPKDVCLRKDQFSFWKEIPNSKLDDKNRKEVSKLIKTDTDNTRYAKALAIHVMKLDRSYVNYADHYCTLNTYNYWTKGRTPVKIIGNHKFYKLIQAKILPPKVVPASVVPIFGPNVPRGFPIRTNPNTTGWTIDPVTGLPMQILK